MTEPHDRPAKYDLSIHSNPDAAAWAKFFMECKTKYGWEVDEELMRAWFANAMMAMHDFMEIQRSKARSVSVEGKPNDT